VIGELLVGQGLARPFVGFWVKLVHKDPPETLPATPARFDQHELARVGLIGWLDDRVGYGDFLRDEAVDMTGRRIELGTVEILIALAGHRSDLRDLLTLHSSL